MLTIELSNDINNAAENNLKASTWNWGMSLRHATLKNTQNSHKH